uniref:Uncharacterized protein n=1 Tax=Tetradesmus obliquus TaxID=3088 RepID=A0A383W6V4_TETOB|eukprot:jgi/Sobl393_1/15770/SZX73181.1
MRWPKSCRSEGQWRAALRAAALLLAAAMTASSDMTAAMCAALRTGAAMTPSSANAGSNDGHAESGSSDNTILLDGATPVGAAPWSASTRWPKSCRSEAQWRAARRAAAAAMTAISDSSRAS